MNNKISTALLLLSLSNFCIIECSSQSSTQAKSDDRKESKSQEPSILKKQDAHHASQPVQSSQSQKHVSFAGLSSITSNVVSQRLQIASSVLNEKDKKQAQEKYQISSNSFKNLEKCSKEIQLYHKKRQQRDKATRLRNIAQEKLPQMYPMLPSTLISELIENNEYEAESSEIISPDYEKIKLTYTGNFLISIYRSGAKCFNSYQNILKQIKQKFTSFSDGDCQNKAQSISIEAAKEKIIEALGFYPLLYICYSSDKFYDWAVKHWNKAIEEKKDIYEDTMEIILDQPQSQIKMHYSKMKEWCTIM